jgi:hypothetical protein
MTETRTPQENIIAEWEKRLGIKIGEPNFRHSLEDELANESIEKVDKVLVSLGLMSPVTSKPKSTTIKDEESWQWINEH